MLAVQHGTVCEGTAFEWQGAAYFSDTLVCQTFVMADGCDSTTCLSLAVLPLSAAVLFGVISQSPACHGLADGRISVTGTTGGVPPYRYSIDSGSVFFPGGEFEGLPSGTYTLVVEDVSGCLEELPVEMASPQPITVNAGPDREIALGEATVLALSTNVDARWWSGARPTIWTAPAARSWGRRRWPPFGTRWR